MLRGTFVTITGFSHYRDRNPFAIGYRLLCQKEPENVFDSEAVCVMARGGCRVGYIANSVNTRANGTSSAGRIYDRVGDYFLIEVCFSTQTKVICQVINFDVKDTQVLREFSDVESGEYAQDIQF